MDRSSINPTAQARKEVPKQELENNNGLKLDQQILREMEMIDLIEYDVDWPVSFGVKIVLKDKRIKLKDMLDGILRTYIDNNDHQKWIDLKRRQAAHEQRKIDLVTYHTSVTNARQIEMDRKWINPTAQPRKEAQKQKVENDNEVRQKVRRIILREKVPQKILHEMTIIDRIEFDCNRSGSLKDTIFLRNRRKNLLDILNEFLRLYIISEEEYKWTDLTLQLAAYKHRNNELMTYHEMVKSSLEKQFEMDRKSINCAAQTSKEAQEPDSKSDNEQRQKARSCVPEEINPHYILREMETIDLIELNVNRPPPLNYRILLKDKMKIWQDMLDGFFRKFITIEDHDRWVDLKERQAEYISNKKKMVANQERLCEIPLPPLLVLPPPQSSSSAQIPLLPVDSQKEDRAHCSTAATAMNQEPSQPVMPTSSGCPTCSLSDMDHDRELDREVEMYTMKWHAEETKASVKPTRLQQQNMSTPSGQNVDDFMEEIETIRKRMNAFCSLRLPYSSQPELGSYKLFPSDPPCRPSHLAMSDVPESDVPARPTNTVEPGQQTQADISGDDVTRSEPTAVMQSEEEVETNASTMACEPDQEDDDRELDLEVERYTTKSQAEEANASVEPATLQQNISTPSGQNVDDDDVTRSVPTVVVESEKGAETNASTMAREPEQEDDGDQSPHPEEPSKDDA